MDTYDKKMQTILDREDLSADERLKLYDQSFTRYLNVYDDYRPRPVVQRSSWPIKSCGTFAYRKASPNVSHPEDLSADERLKLYDQSFTRYLNVYDDYRPRPVAVAP
jgi:hypothetical protein